MKLIINLIQLLLLLNTAIHTSSLFFTKTKKDNNYHLIAAKYHPEMPMNIRKILEEVGDNPVIKIQLGRTPVEAILILFLNIVSLWKFNNKQLELGYDEIYHNYLLITIQNDKSPKVLQQIFGGEKDTLGSMVYKLEKAHRVRLLKPVFPTEFVDIYDIPLTSNKTFTLNRLITTASNIDKHFYTYDAGNNNMCQTFVENIVDLNGLTPNILDNSTQIALKPQDAKALVATLGSRSDIVKYITDLGGKIDKLVFDHKIKWKKPIKKEFTLFGDMHIKTVDETVHNNTNEVLLKSNADTIVENVDDVFNAVVALEEDDKKKKQKQSIIIIIGIIILILMISLAAMFTYFIWKKRKGLDQRIKKESVNNAIIESKSDSSLSTNMNTIAN
ncbi:unnamed protein product [Adineta steineri]|uniref:Uncharacterized protein n=2 Tax=Adineta steineri TaxID=433720 RepID=A0A814CBS3_9BILA|nr:unnamed protein product [Adineta steineri]